MENNIKYFEEKFNRVFDKLDTIDQRVAKINGKVAEQEQRLQLIEKEELKHYTRCPNTKVLQELSNELMEYRIMKKYPKLFIIGAGVFFVGSVLIFLTKIGII